MTPNLFPQQGALHATHVGLERLGRRSWVFRIPRALHSPNRTIWRGRWVMAAERAAWEQEFEGCLAAFQALRNVQGWPAEDWREWSQLVGVRERRAVCVWRVVPSPRYYLHDQDNLDFVAKHLVDAMKRVRLIHDDSNEWLTRTRPREALSGDGTFYTVVQLDRPDVSGAWL